MLCRPTIGIGKEKRHNWAGIIMSMKSLSKPSNVSFIFLIFCLLGRCLAGGLHGISLVLFIYIFTNRRSPMKSLSTGRSLFFSYYFYCLVERPVILSFSFYRLFYGRIFLLEGSSRLMRPIKGGKKGRKRRYQSFTWNFISCRRRITKKYIANKIPDK